MKILFVNPSGTLDAYKDTRLTAPVYPNLTLAALAGVSLQAGHETSILDLSLRDAPHAHFSSVCRREGPDLIGFTFATASVPEIVTLVELARKEAPEAVLTGGGCHGTALPEATLEETGLDIVVIGEGEATLSDLIRDGSPGARTSRMDEIPGICYRAEGVVTRNAPRTLLPDLDALPFPAWSLYDLGAYRRIDPLWRKAPVGNIETSRGCVGRCCFCVSNLVFGRRFRRKSIGRVVDEIEAMLEVGFSEIHVQDDGFLIQLERGKEICREILRRGFSFPWELYNGVRLDQIDTEFLDLARRAGCYRIRVGVETGDPDLLEATGKGLTLDDIRRGFRALRRSAIETVGMFVIGLPGETEQTMQRTIDFAIEIAPDIAKVSIVMPFPGSSLYRQWSESGAIFDYGWSHYDLHNRRNFVYRHPTVANDTIERYYERFYRRFYFRPSYILRRAWRGLRRGHFLSDVKYFLTRFAGLGRG